MEQNIQWEQLARYFAGELTREEHQKMESWIKADPEREQQVRELYKIWKKAGIYPYKLNVDEAWNTLSGNMDKLEQRAQHANQILSRLRNKRVPELAIPNGNQAQQSGAMIRRIFMTAAAATIILAAGLFTYYYNFNNNENIEVAIRQLTAREGERATYVLNDGSKVVLHAGSRLEVPMQYNVESRELFLEGEAYFEVTHDSTKPFTVHSENAYTRVLGTKFLVQAWPGAKGEVEVVVAEGKVALGDSRTRATGEKKEVIITRNQKGALSGDKELVVTGNVDMNWYLGWTQGRLIFNDRPFIEIIPKLERWYVLDIQIEDQSIGAKRLTAEIDYNQPMSEVMKGIALSLDLELEREGRTVLFQLKEQDN